jgi:catechol 2,3-dioxygenase-like lactoylglutathione lyase family enzyme
MKNVLSLALAVIFHGGAQAQLAGPNSAGVAMGHVHLNVRDVEAQKKFWIGLFSAAPLKKETLAGVKLPGMLILFEERVPSGPSEGSMMDHFGLKVPNLAAALERCRAAQCAVQREFKGTEGFPNAYLIGPDGVKIELQQDTALQAPAIAYHLHYTSPVGGQIALRDWYAKTFSAVVKKRGDHDAADIPGMNLTFGTSKTPPTIPTKGRSIDHIGFEVKNLKTFCRKLQADGLKLDVAFRKLGKTGISSAFLTDPTGTLIELTEGLDRY